MVDQYQSVSGPDLPKSWAECWSDDTYVRKYVTGTVEYLKNTWSESEPYYEIRSDRIYLDPTQYGPIHCHSIMPGLYTSVQTLDTLTEHTYIQSMSRICGMRTLRRT